MYKEGIETFTRPVIKPEVGGTGEGALTETPLGQITEFLENSSELSAAGH